VLSTNNLLITEVERSQLSSETILLDSFFYNHPSSHGGTHRTQQVLELIEQAQLSILPFERKILKTKLERYRAGISATLNLKTFQFILKNRISISPYFSALAFCGFQRKLYHSVLGKHAGAKLLIWEATKNYVAPYVAKETGFKVVALPHNLEALVPKQDGFFEDCETEIRALAKADVIFCIAREEEWLLRLNGVNAYYLPYYPPRSIVEKLLNIRQSRLNLSRSRFLILGTANNPPTRLGMIEQLEWLHDLTQEFGFQVDVVGYGTEQLKDYCTNENVTIHGAVSSEELDQFLLQAKALLVHQKPSTGALTRIPEAIIAGIPVIANSIACRSAFDYSGVYCYYDRDELVSFMRQDLAIPEILPRPIAAEKHFIKCLLELAH
jgi:glycosyltransferase involved in cell wall biosynthesis